MPEIKKYSTVDALHEANEKFNGKTAVLGKSSMTFADYINSTRTQMFTAHLNQFLVIDKPEFPYVFTGAENVVGENNDSFKELEYNYEVVAKVVKYADILDVPNYYCLFLWNTEKSRYEVIERKETEFLSENFAFNWNNERIDEVKVGDNLEKGDVLYKSTSYDEDMNYQYGRNAKVAYSLIPWAAEDAALISKSFSKAMTVTKGKTITMGMNLNEVFLNMYGTKEEYKILPDIGEKCGAIIAAIRQIQNDQIYYDLSDENLLYIKDADRCYFSEGNGSVVLDYDIFCNNDELEDNIVTHQILKYSKAQDKFYKELKQVCKELIDTGYDCSNEIHYLLKRAKEFLNRKKKWKNSNENCFGNIEIDVKITAKKPLGVGGKFTARMGNKCVVAKVLEDDEMMMLDNGEHVDVVLNLLAITNRTTGFVLHELYITFALNRLREKLRVMTVLKEREKLFFEFLTDLYKKEADYWKREYKDMSTKEKEEFMRDCIEDGIYIEQPPIWEEESIFYRLYRLRNKYEWLKPYKVSVKKWGQVFPTLRDVYVGEMYFIRLKQTGERGFSARNTGAVNLKGLPERSYKNRNNTSPVSDSAIRLGESEFLALTSCMSGDELMTFHALYRTSVKGRTDIGKAMFSDDPISKIDDSYNSVTAQLFSSIFKSLSLEVRFEDEDRVYRELDNDHIRQRDYGGKTYFATDKEFYKIRVREQVKDAILEVNPIISTEDLNKETKEAMKKVNTILKVGED